MARIVIAFVILAILGVVAAVGAQNTIEAGGNDVTVDNETWDPQPTGEVTQLDDSEQANTFYDAEVRVWDTTGTDPVEMTAGTDYEWLPRNGTVRPLANGSLEDATEASITYGYTENTDRETDMLALSAHLPTIIGLALPLFAIILLARFIGG